MLLWGRYFFAAAVREARGLTPILQLQKSHSSACTISAKRRTSGAQSHDRCCCGAAIVETVSSSLKSWDWLRSAMLSKSSAVTSPAGVWLGASQLDMLPAARRELGGGVAAACGSFAVCLCWLRGRAAAGPSWLRHGVQCAAGGCAARRAACQFEADLLSSGM
eukprot:SAG31_NODE_4862_length_2901_cov_12.896000_3_plen_163_part_00